jgi:hypothetical protein
MIKGINFIITSPIKSSIGKIIAATSAEISYFPASEMRAYKGNIPHCRGHQAEGYQGCDDTCGKLLRLAQQANRHFVSFC